MVVFIFCLITTHCLHFMQKKKYGKFAKLIKELEIQKNFISNGKLHTSATTLFKLCGRVADYFEEATAQYDEWKIFGILSNLMRNFLSLTSSTRYPNAEFCAHYRCVTALYYLFFTSFVLKLHQHHPFKGDLKCLK